MRIVVSGTHASGKSTLVAGLAGALPDHEVFDDPYELVDEDLAPASAESFLAQLHVSAERLLALPPRAGVLAERGPVDFLAYLEALAELGRGGLEQSSWERLRLLAARAMAHVDLWVVLALDPDDPVHVPAEEDLDLRAVTDERLLDLVDDDDLVGGVGRVLEVRGTPDERLAQVVAALAALGELGRRG